MTNTNSKSIIQNNYGRFEVEGYVNYQELRKELQIKVEDLAEAIGTTPRLIERNPDAEVIHNGLRKIAYIVSLVKEMLPTLNQKKEWLSWLKRAHLEFDGLTPWEVMQNGDCDAIVGYL